MKFHSALLILILFSFEGMSRRAAGQAGPSLPELIEKADVEEKAGNHALAVQHLSQADELYPHRLEVLCRLARDYFELMHRAKNKEDEKRYGEAALLYARDAVNVDTNNPMAHLCLAAAYGKNMKFVGTQQKVDYSKRMKTEAECCIRLDPTLDVPYYLLGRWNYEVANMGWLSRHYVKSVYGSMPTASNDEAIRNLRKAIELNPKRVMHHAELARVYHATGQEKLAQKEFELCRTLVPLDMDDETVLKRVLKEHPAEAQPKRK